MKPTIRVLVADDSPVEQELLRHMLQSDPAIKVVATVKDGAEAIETACRERPDVITMDVHMPHVDGLEATRQIMEKCPVPIVIVSASPDYSQEGARSFYALSAGALALVRKPPGPGHPRYGIAAEELIQTVKLMSEVPVVRRSAQRAAGAPVPPPVEAPQTRLIAVGASAGGPPALQRLLADLPKGFPAPLLIVQHMASGFIQGFAQWLWASTGFPVHVAVQGEQAQAGHAYVAPTGLHLGMASEGRIVLSDDPPEGGLRPAVSYLFRSVAKVYGKHAVGVLLTGMGRDGAAELKALKDRGAVTIAQDEETSLVFGMPGEAINLGGATYVLPVDRIGAMLTSLANQGKALHEHHA